MNKKLTHLPTLDSVEKGIQSFRAIPFERLDSLNSYKEVIIELDKIFKNLNIYYGAFIIRETLPDTIGTLSTFRARKAEEVINRHYIDEFSYCPIPICKTRQRANFEYHPVFYASDHPRTALGEVFMNSSQPIGNSYFIARWDVTNMYKLRYTSLTYKQLTSDNYYSILNNNLEEQIRKVFGSDLTEDQILAQLKLHEFYSSLFLDTSYRNVTAYIAHRNLFHPTNFHSEILMYPSVQADKRNLNFAIHPNAIHYRSELKYIYKIIVKALSKESTTLSLTHVGIQQQGFIYWFGIEEETEKSAKYITQFKKDMSIETDSADLVLENIFYQYQD